MSHNDRNGAVVVMVVTTVTCSMPSAGCEPRPLVLPVSFPQKNLWDTFITPMEQMRKLRLRESPAYVHL